MSFHEFMQDLPAEEGRYSFGTTPVIDTMIDVINKENNKQGYVIFINVDTMIRNRCRKDKKIPVIGQEILDDISTMFTELGDTLKLANPISRHAIVFYSMDYSRMIPDEYRRKSLSESTLKRNEVIYWVKKRLQSYNQLVSNIATIIKFSDTSNLSYKELEKIHNEQGGKQHILMCSHQALDYHIFSSTRQGRVIRSFQGTEIIGAKKPLSERVFKNEDVPFYPVFHVLLGDRELIKSCLGRKDKTRLLELAKQHNWVIRTNTYVKDAIKNNNFALPYTLE